MAAFDDPQRPASPALCHLAGWVLTALLRGPGPAWGVTGTGGPVVAAAVWLRVAQALLAMQVSVAV